MAHSYWADRLGGLGSERGGGEWAATAAWAREKKKKEGGEDLGLRADFQGEGGGEK